MFVPVAFLLLGIERFLYGYIYHFPESFKLACREGPLKVLLDRNQGRFWEVAQNLGVIIKIFQFGVIGYDLAFRLSLTIAQPLLLVIALVLLALGQTLNVTVFNAIGGVGVYYGSQLGYDVPWAKCFPYNMGIGDPQYWGVVLTVWGAYLALSPHGNIFGAHFVVPWLELFWYVMSMKLLEDQTNGGAVLRALGLKPSKAK